MGKWKSLLIVPLFLTFANCTPNIRARLVTEAEYYKIVNGDAGVEFKVKTTISIDNSVDIKLGASQGYTALRQSPYSMNHAGVRVDVGVLWKVSRDFKVGYTHSERKWFDGAYPKTGFIYDSVDSISVRKEFDLEF